MKVLHIITDLSMGGAQRALARLVANWPDQRISNHVLCLGAEGTIASAIREADVPVKVLNGRGRRDAPRLLRASSQYSKQIGACIVQGWMYDGNLAAWWGSRAVRGKLVWNVRHSVLDLATEPRGTRLAIRTNRRFSRTPAAILYNSAVAAEQHAALGFEVNRARVIPNGFDLDVFRPDANARGCIRAELGIASDAFVVGHVARYHPMKDHLTALNAAAELCRSVPKAYFVFVGSRMDSANGELQDEVQARGLDERVRLLGERSDAAAINAAFDVAVSSSAWGEGFSNALGEAICCAVPCVATEVGEARTLVGPAGEVVPSGRPDALAEALKRFYDMGPETRCSLGQLGRQRALEYWSLASVAKQYNDLYHNLMEHEDGWNSARSRRSGKT